MMGGVTPIFGWWPGKRVRRGAAAPGCRISVTHAKALHLAAYGVWCNGAGSPEKLKAWLEAVHVLDCLKDVGLTNEHFQWTGPPALKEA
jgi:hypothetical protein